MSSNAAAAKNGGEVFTASSVDPAHPPSAMISNDETSFWASTGSYPQEFVVQLGSRAAVTNIRLRTTNVKSLVVERCKAPVPTSWEKIASMTLDENDGRMQVASQTVNSQDANYLKFHINSGYQDFCSVHTVSVSADDGM
eukprot:g1323.t1